MFDRKSSRNREQLDRDCAPTVVLGLAMLAALGLAILAINLTSTLLPSKSAAPMTGNHAVYSSAVHVLCSDLDAERLNVPTCQAYFRIPQTDH